MEEEEQKNNPAALPQWRSDRKTLFQSTQGQHLRAQKRKAGDEFNHLVTHLNEETLTELAEVEMARKAKAHTQQLAHLEMRRVVLEQDMARYQNNRAFQRQRNEVQGLLAELDAAIAKLKEEDPTAELRGKLEEFVKVVRSPAPVDTTPAPPRPTPVAAAKEPKDGEAPAPKRPRVQATLASLCKPASTAGSAAAAADQPPPPSAADAEAATSAQKAWRAQVAQEFRAEIQGVRVQQSVDHDHCPNCQVPMVLTEMNSLLKCVHCGQMQTFLDITISTKGYGEDTTPMQGGDYKRLSYLRDRISKAQAQQGPQVQESIVQAVQQYIMNHYKSPAGEKLAKEQITEEMVVSSVRALQLSKCYDQAPQIYTRITGKLPMQMTPEQERTLAAMFDQVQGVFDRNKHRFQKKKGQSRQNLLSYHYWSVTRLYAQCFIVLLTSGVFVVGLQFAQVLHAARLDGSGQALHAAQDAEPP